MKLGTQSLTGTYVMIYSLDDAIDRGDKDRDTKWEHRLQVAHDTGDVSQLPLVDGEQPALWVFRHPDGKLRRRLLSLRHSIQQSESHPDRQFDAACEMIALSLERVDNLADSDTGESFELEFVRRDGFRAVSDEQMSIIALYDGGALLVEMMKRVIETLDAPKN